MHVKVDEKRRKTFARRNKPETRLSPKRISSLCQNPFSVTFVTRRSSDGSKIAFTRGPSSGLIGDPGPYNVVVVNPDGSNLRQLTDGVDATYAMTWMPDGRHLLYSVASRDGASLHIIDVQTGEVSSLPGIDTASVAVSPDGMRLAFDEMLPIDKYGLFVSNLDGSNRKLLADGNPTSLRFHTGVQMGNG